jgi:hypothetical protein
MATLKRKSLNGVSWLWKAVLVQLSSRRATLSEIFLSFTMSSESLNRSLEWIMIIIKLKD